MQLENFLAQIEAARGLEDLQGAVLALREQYRVNHIDSVAQIG